MKHRFMALATAAIVLCAPTHALAHPHVFAEARLEVITSQNGQVEELRHVWRFDELFSSSVLLDFDANANLKLDPEEKRTIGNVVKESLAEFDYYTSLQHRNAEVGILPPDEICSS